MPAQFLSLVALSSAPPITTVSGSTHVSYVQAQNYASTTLAAFSTRGAAIRCEDNVNNSISSFEFYFSSIEPSELWIVISWDGSTLDVLTYADESSAISTAIALSATRTVQGVLQNSLGDWAPWNIPLTSSVPWPVVKQFFFNP